MDEEEEANENQPLLSVQEYIYLFILIISLFRSLCINIVILKLS